MAVTDTDIVAVVVAAAVAVIVVVTAFVLTIGSCYAMGGARSRR